MITRCFSCLLLLLLGLAPASADCLISNLGQAKAQGTELEAVITNLSVPLILLGIAFIIAEAFLPSFGVIGFSGIVAFVVGAVILIDTDAPGFGIPLTLIGALAVLSALMIGGLLGMALKARRRALVSGDAGLVGSLVTVTQVMAGNPFCGSVQAQGEQWQAQCATPLQLGQNVRVTARHGVMLEVSAAAPAAQGDR